MAWATPAGPVTDEFFEHVADTLVTGCAWPKPDGVLLALHGAMVTPKHPDADAEVLRRVRAALGPKVPIAVTLDFHGNVSAAMAETRRTSSSAIRPTRTSISGSAACWRPNSCHGPVKGEIRPVSPRRQAADDHQPARPGHGPRADEGADGAGPRRGNAGRACSRSA